MFEKPSRKDRCEFCRWAADESRLLPYLPSRPGVFEPMVHKETKVIVCKRMPPTAYEDGRCGSPVVWAGNYCGEFSKKINK